MDEDDEELKAFMLCLEKTIEQIESSDKVDFKKIPIVEQLSNISLEDINEPDE